MSIEGKSAGGSGTRRLSVVTVMKKTDWSYAGDCSTHS